MKINKFEDILAWQESRNLVKRLYEITSEGKINKDFRFCSQLQSASVSIMNNIAEGFARNSSKEFIRFLFIAKSSAAEVQSLLYVALDLRYINQNKFDELYNQADKISRLISNFIKYLTQRNKRNQRNERNKRNKLSKSDLFNISIY